MSTPRPKRRTTCAACLYAKVSYAEIQCRHPFQTGRVMARDLRRERSPMRFVTGMEWAAHCTYRRTATKRGTTTDSL